MAEYLIQSETLDDIADAINAKTGGSSAMTPAEMVTAIGSIQTGGGDFGNLVMHTGEITVISPVSDVEIIHGFSEIPLIIIVYPKTAVVNNPYNNIIGGAYADIVPNIINGVDNVPTATASTNMTQTRFGWYTNETRPNGAQELNSRGSYIKSPSNTNFLFGGGGTYPVLNTTYIWKAYAFERSGS